MKVIFWTLSVVEPFWGNSSSSSWFAIGESLGTSAAETALFRVIGILINLLGFKRDVKVFCCSFTRGAILGRILNCPSFFHPWWVLAFQRAKSFQVWLRRNACYFFFREVNTFPMYWDPPNKWRVTLKHIKLASEPR